MKHKQKSSKKARNDQQVTPAKAWPCLLKAGMESSGFLLDRGVLTGGGMATTFC